LAAESLESRGQSTSVEVCSALTNVDNMGALFSNSTDSHSIFLKHIEDL